MRGMIIESGQEPFVRAIGTRFLRIQGQRMQEVDAPEM